MINIVTIILVPTHAPVMTHTRLILMDSIVMVCSKFQALVSEY